MTTHILKCWPEPYAAMRDGRKLHEFRKDDRGYAVGDKLLLQEWVPHASHPDGGFFTTSPDLHRWVTYIGRDGFGIPAGYCVMSVTATPPAEIDAARESSALAQSLKDDAVIMARAVAEFGGES